MGEYLQISMDLAVFLCLDKSFCDTISLKKFNFDM